MPDEAVSEIVPHNELLLLIIRKRTLDNPAALRLVDDIQTAAARRTGVPIVLDMSQVKFAPSVALGSLVQLQRSFQFDRRRIALVGVDRRVREALNITRLDQVLEVYDKLEDMPISAPPP